jgi:hypothetical protein
MVNGVIILHFYIIKINIRDTITQIIIQFILNIVFRLIKIGKNNKLIKKIIWHIFILVILIIIQS